jgi:hypothetical protein
LDARATRLLPLLLGLCAASAAGEEGDLRPLLEAGHWKQARAVLEPRVKANPADAEAAALLSRVRVATAISPARSSWPRPRYD